MCSVSSSARGTWQCIPTKLCMPRLTRLVLALPRSFARWRQHPRARAAPCSPPRPPYRKLSCFVWYLPPRRPRTSGPAGDTRGARQTAVGLCERKAVESEKASIFRQGDASRPGASAARAGGRSLAARRGRVTHKSSRDGVASPGRTCAGSGATQTAANVTPLATDPSIVCAPHWGAGERELRQRW